MEKITLKAARVNANLTIKQAAQQIGVDVSTIIRWERNPGIIKADYQKRIQEVYKYPIDYIFFG